MQWKQEVHFMLAIFNPITSNNFSNFFTDSRVGFSHLQGDILSMHHNQYYGGDIHKLLPVLLSIFTSISLCFQLARQDVFHLIPCNFTRICFGFLKNPCGFFPWFLTRIPIILFLQKSWNFTTHPYDIYRGDAYMTSTLRGQGRGVR